MLGRCRLSQRRFQGCWLFLVARIYWDLDDGVFAPREVNKAAPVRIDNDTLAACNHEHEMLRPCQSYVHSFHIGKEADSTTTSTCTHTREDDYSSLPPLERVNSAKSGNVLG